MKLYEILIPVADNEKRVFSRIHRKVWEKVVRDTAGGLSTCAPVDGQWVDGGKVYSERMQPVRIACSAPKIRKLAEFAKGHFRQLSIMYYPVSPEVRFL